MIKSVKHYVIKVYQGKYKMYSCEEEIEKRESEIVKLSKNLIKFCFFDRNIRISGDTIYEEKGENYSTWIWNGERTQDLDNSSSHGKSLCKTSTSLYVMGDEDITVSEYMDIKEEEKSETIRVLDMLSKEFISYIGEECNERINDRSKGRIDAMKYALLCINAEKRKITECHKLPENEEAKHYEKRVSTR